jgi:Protein of unknown function (DUF3363)
MASARSSVALNRWAFSPPRVTPSRSRYATWAESDAERKVRPRCWTTPALSSPGDPRPTLVLANRSDIDLDLQVTAPGATWLDYRLVKRERMPLAMSGFGQEVRDALAARAVHLAAEVDLDAPPLGGC